MAEETDGLAASDIAPRDGDGLAADGPSWTGALEGVSAALYHLITGTEDEFLSVGRDMTDFYTRAREIARMLSTLLGIMSGGEITDTMDGLRGMVAHISSGVGGAEDEFTRGVKALGETIRIVDTVQVPLTRFKKLVKILKILSISIKIESGQLGQDQAGFVTLADDVEKLSALIETKTANIASKALLLNTIIRQNISRISTLEDRQRLEIQKVLDTIGLSLSSLAEKNESSRRGADVIARESEEISSRIGDVVSAMQYHDITRQTIEHVKEAIDGLLVRLGAAGTGKVQESDADSLKLAFETGKICELQKAHLEDAGKQIVGATRRINENLLSIKESIMELSRKTGDLAGTADESSLTFLSKVENGLGPAISSLRENAASRSDLSAAMDDFLATTRDMSGSVDDIEEISTEIELIALNARIKTAHTGTKGAPLGVIAEAIQKLSFDANEHKTAISTTLATVMATAESLRSHAHLDRDSRASETDGMIDDLNRFVGTLREANNRITALLNDIGASGRALAVDIERTVTGVTVQDTFSRVIDDAVATLNVILTESRRITKRADWQGLSEYLERLEANYTMQSERAIHDSVTGANRAGGEGHVPLEVTGIAGNIPPPSGDGQEFGDNVELF